MGRGKTIILINSGLLKNFNKDHNKKRHDVIHVCGIVDLSPFVRRLGALLSGINVPIYPETEHVV